MSDMNDEFDALLVKIRSPETRRAGDALFSAAPPDLSVTYLPDNFKSADDQLDPKLIYTICKK